MKAKPSKNGESAAKSFERLCECEKFMVAMMTVKQSKRKIRALLFKLQFRGCIHDLAHGELTEMRERESERIIFDAHANPFNSLHHQMYFLLKRPATN